MDNATPYIGSIYGLTCSCEPGHIRYVGLTTSTIEDRLVGHLREAVYKYERESRKLVWIRMHLANGHQIRTQLLLDCAESCEELVELEWCAIWACRRNGHDLLNTTLKGVTLDEEACRERSTRNLNNEKVRAAGRLGGVASAHSRWHVGRGVTKPGCPHCSRARME